MSKKAIIDDGTSKVANVIIADDSFQPSDGYSLVDVTERPASPGQIYDSANDEFHWPLALDVRKTEMLAQASGKYQQVLADGVSYDGGQFRLDDLERRQRVAEIVNRINAGRGLPNGKTTMRFRNMTDSIHDLNETDILDLGEAADNLIDAAEDRLGEIKTDIKVATSHSDLDAIDVNSGWPS